MRPSIRLHVVMAASYFLYTGIATAVLILSVVVGSQAASGCMLWLLVFAIAITSPIPMLLVGFAFLRDNRWAVATAVSLALAQAVATAMQSRITGGSAVGELATPRAALFYVCAAQMFYLPGSLFLAPLSSLTLLRRPGRASASLCAILAVACAAAAGRERQFPVGNGPGVVVTADVNRDGNADLVVANEKGGTISVLLGDGRGGFSEAAGSPFAAGPDPNDLAIADFNRDGFPDVAVANHEVEQLTILLGNGRGAFTPARHSPLQVAVKPHPHGVATGDFDGDGSQDLVTDSWAEDRLEILFNDGKGDFRTPGIYVSVGKHPYQRIRTADVNRDGNADIVSPDLEGNDVTVLLGNGKGGFLQPAGSPFPCGDSPFNVAIGDVNGDGLADMAIVNSPSSTSDRSGRDGLTVLLGDGHGRFQRLANSPFTTKPFPNMVAIGDIDGDHVGDVVVSNPENDRITVFLMGRNGVLRSRKDIVVRGHPKGLVVHDFDGDGKGDIVVSNNARNTITVVFGG